MYSCCNIGCNIVAPEVDDIPGYTRDIYLKRVADYRLYGFSHLEFSHLLSLDLEDASCIREACRSVGIVPWSVHSEHLNEGGSQEEYFRTQEHCAKTAEALDARVMVCHLPNLTPRFDFARALEILSQLADITARHHVRLAIENCGFKGDIDFIIRIIDAMNRSDTGFNLDTGHAFYSETCDVAGMVRKIGKRLITTHLHDNFGENDDHQPPGLGRIDWHAVLKAFHDVAYNGPLMMEMTGNGMKKQRSVGELRDFDLEKELISGAAYLHFQYNRVNREAMEESR